jgi:benzoate/toluate 1,2-dioxygenase beta subunit
MSTQARPVQVEISGEALVRKLTERLFEQAELLDNYRWRDYIELFAKAGRYWMPSYAEQSSWTGEPSIFSEDRDLMTVRQKRLEHPRAWSMAAAWGTSHIVSNIRLVTPALDDGSIRTTARFHVTERRRDDFRSFAGKYTHDWIWEDGEYRIALQRVDLLGPDVPFDYVIQAWL